MGWLFLHQLELLLVQPMCDIRECSCCEVRALNEIVQTVLSTQCSDLLFEEDPRRSLRTATIDLMARHCQSEINFAPSQISGRTCLDFLAKMVP